MNRIIKKEYFGIMAISSAILMFEMLLVRIFSVVLPSNFTFFAITVTLFGVAIGGLLVYIFKKHFRRDNFQKRVVQYSILTGISLVFFMISFFWINFTNIPPISFLIAVTISSIPFILGNITLVLFFQNKSEKIKTLYFSDLIGAGLGVILALIAMQFMGPINGLFCCAILTFIAALIFSNKKTRYFKWSSVLLLIIIIGLSTNIYFDYIKIRTTKIGDETEHVIFKKWNTFSRITAYDNGNIFYNYLTDPPEVYRILIDSDAATETINFDGNFDEVSFLQNDLTSTAYQISQPGSSLIIGPGGGRDVLTALSLGFNVKGVEINPIIINDLVKDEFKDFSGDLYNRDDVELVVSEGRSFLEKDKNTYKVIHIPLVDTWASTSAGNLTLTESYLYTVEAFEQYLSHLTAGGILSLTRWELDGMRLLSLFFAASENLNINNYEKNIAIITVNEGKRNQLNNYLFKAEPFTDNEINSLKLFVQTNGFSLTYLPEENIDNHYNEYINNENRLAFIESYSKNLEPVFDDKPFFFFAAPMLRSAATDNSHHNEKTFFLVLFTTIIVSLIIILLPLAATNKNKIQSTNTNLFKSISFMFYFACLGLGFLMLELTLIQKFILYLEKPIFSYSIVLISLLLSAGLGSYISEKISSRQPKNFFYIASSICLLIIISFFLFGPLVSATISLELFWKIIISTLINAPIGFFMGMMLPMGIKRLQILNRQDLIPWAWASNGAMSVTASVLAMLLSINLGFNKTMLIAGALYLIAPVFIYLSYKTPEKIIQSNQNPESNPDH